MFTSNRARRWGVVIAAGLISAMALVAEAAPGLGTVKHYRLPTSTNPHDVTTASDGNVWFTVQGAFNPVTFFTPGSVARVTPRGEITEFVVCDTCITNDIVEGPDGILYISDNNGTVAPDPQQTAADGISSGSVLSEHRDWIDAGGS